MGRPSGGGWLYPVMAAVAGFVLALPPLMITRQELVRTRGRLARTERESATAGAALVRLDPAGSRIAVPAQPVALEVDTGPGRAILYLESAGRLLARHEVVADAGGRAVLLVGAGVLAPGAYRLRVESGGATREFPLRVE